MKTARQTTREGRELFRACLVNGVLDEGRAQGAVDQVLDGKHRGYLAVLSQFQRWVKRYREQHTARIESAVPLPADLQTRMSTGVQAAYGPGVNIQFIHRPELIGGVRVKVGSHVYDGSMRHELSELERSFGTARGPQG